jgi:hypothetical protein
LNQYSAYVYMAGRNGAELSAAPFMLDPKQKLCVRRHFSPQSERVQGDTFFAALPLDQGSVWQSNQTMVTITHQKMSYDADQLLVCATGGGGAKRRTGFPPD